MKCVTQIFPLSLIAVCAIAGQHGDARAGISGGHQHSAIRTLDHGRKGGYSYGYGGYGYGGYYEPYYDSGYPPPSPAGSNLTVVYPAAAAPEPPAPVHPVIHEYGQPEGDGTSAPSNNGPILYLIAFRDKNIRAATTYWVDAGTLHYLDTDHRERQAPIASVDRELSTQLNQERRVPFNLP
jgi:hypothetical protein